VFKNAFGRLILSQNCKC